jgi:hypothetical protein
MRARWSVFSIPIHFTDYLRFAEGALKQSGKPRP